MSLQHDWYQTDSKIFISVIIRNAEDKYSKVTIEPSKISIRVEKVVLELNLLHPVVPAKSTYKSSTKKIEVSLTKETCARWESLVKNVAEKLPGAPTKNWDNIVNESVETENEEEPDEEKLAKIFQKIYLEGSLEVKLAMTKSFFESEGTVLSTNWEKVRRKKVEVQPRDG